MASDDGNTDEGVGCSLPGGTTFGSIGAEAMFPPEPGFVLSAGLEASSPRMLQAMSSWRTSITHSIETYSDTDRTCGSKLSPIDWMSPMLRPSAYPL